MISLVLNKLISVVWQFSCSVAMPKCRTAQLNFNLLKALLLCYYAHLLKQPAIHLSTVASKMVSTYPKNENPIKSPKAPPSELNKSMLLNIRTSSLMILIFSVKLKKNKTFVTFSQSVLDFSTLVEYVTKDFCFKHTLAFFLKNAVAA